MVGSPNHSTVYDHILVIPVLVQTAGGMACEIPRHVNLELDIPTRGAGAVVARCLLQLQQATGDHDRRCRLQRKLCLRSSRDDMIADPILLDFFPAGSGRSLRCAECIEEYGGWEE